MLSNLRIPNPHYPGSPARMSDARLFTDYRPNGQILQGATPSFDLKQRLQRDGEIRMKTDRSLTVMSAGGMGPAVDTMVPEQTKRTCSWNECHTLPAFSVGIGQGRLYLPGMPGLVQSDPDVSAAIAGSLVLHGTFSANPVGYTAAPTYDDGVVRTVQTSAANRYSAPFGN